MAETTGKQEPPTINILKRGQLNAKNQTTLDRVKWEAIYRHDDNTVSFVDMKDYDEDECLITLIHEINHWAFHSKMNDYENGLAQKSYTFSINNHQVPFEEWINPADGAYDYTEWEYKNNILYFNIDYKM